MELAEVDIQRIRLQAEYAHNEKLLASRNAQLSTLQGQTRCACSRKSRSPPASNNRARKPPPWPTSRRTCASNCAICSARSMPLQAQQALGGAGASSARQISARLRVRHDIAGPSGPACILPGDPHIDPMALKVFDLQCEHSHIFEGWFGSHEDYDAQQARGLVTCPVCGSASITKRLSAPRLNVAHLHAPPRQQAEATPGRPRPAAAGRRP